MKTLIIAEVGVNHNGDLSTAKLMIDSAKESGADIVKFQTFRTENLVTQTAKLAHYQAENVGKSISQYNMLKRLELSVSAFEELSNYCEKQEIEFLSTAFDDESINDLVRMGMKRWKIPSGEITNLPYLRKITSLGMPIILSTGMSHLWEVEDAVRTIEQGRTPDLKILHCTTEYPAPYEEVNLSAMQTMRQHFGLPVGYSDHTKGIEVAIAAVALGAVVIEKHFTLSREMEGPDHKASLEPDEFKEMVRCIRNIELALGDGNKVPSSTEMKNIQIARKSITAKRDIVKGETFTVENLTVKRPGTGISPMKWDTVIGTTAKRHYYEDETIDL